MKIVLRSGMGAALLKYLIPGWLDESRLIIQIHAFNQVLKGNEFYGKCLNGGCGEGLYSEFLESFKGITEIVNLDLELPSIPQQRSDARHKAYQGSLTHIPFEAATFDACLCTEVLEHIEQDSLAMSELARVVKPGGLLLISVPTPPAPYDQAHVREGYTLEDLSILLNKNNFIVINHAYCFHFFMRFLFHLWQWQFARIGRYKQSWMPRFVVRGFGYADKYFKLGKPWDLVIMAQKVK